MSFVSSSASQASSFSGSTEIPNETVVSMSPVTNDGDATKVVSSQTSSVDAASWTTVADTQTTATTTGNAAVNTATGNPAEQETTWESTSVTGMTKSMEHYRT